MKNNKIYHNKRNRNKSIKIINNKNIISNSNAINTLVGSNNKSNLTSIKKEIISKNNEESNFISKKSNNQLKKKSIDNLLQKNKMFNLTNSINRNSLILQNQIEQKNSNNSKINQTNNYIPKNIANRNSIKRQSFIEYPNLNRIINEKTKKKSCPNITSPYIPTDKSYSKEIYLDSNGSIYESDLIKNDKKNIVTTFVQIEDLTKIPERKEGTPNKYADYDYNEAKRAAVTCRRIEYSYNLRNVIKSEISLDEIIIIQRWWRDILRKRNEQISKELRILDKINVNNIQKYILSKNFLNS